MKVSEVRTTQLLLQEVRPDYKAIIMLHVWADVCVWVDVCVCVFV